MTRKKSCPECSSREIYDDEDRGEILCRDCGLVLGNIGVDISGNQAYRPSLKGNFETPEEYMARQQIKREHSVLEKLSGAEDPEWADSPVIVKSKENRKTSSTSGKSLAKQLLDASVTSISDSPALDLHEKAMNYLGSNPSSPFDRSELFRPFYGVHQRGVSLSKTIDGLTAPDIDTFVEDRAEASRGFAAAAKQRGANFIGKVTDVSNLPGPICTLLSRTNLPPRAYQVPENTGPNGSEPFDSMGETTRIDFEMYFDLLCIQNKPWPLHLWAEQIHLGGGVFDVLAKGGALSRQAGDYLLQLYQGTITEFDVAGFMQNIIDHGMIDITPDIRIEIQNEALKILEELQNKSIQHEEKETDLLSLLLETNCLASFKGSSETEPTPTIFWRFSPAKEIQELGNLRLISIPIALAVATGIAIQGLSCDSVIELAQTDVRHGLTNAKSVDGRAGLNDCWRFLMDQIGRESNILFP